jgi:hypothetical protein
MHTNTYIHGSRAGEQPRLIDQARARKPSAAEPP